MDLLDTVELFKFAVVHAYIRQHLQDLLGRTGVQKDLPNVIPMRLVCAGKIHFIKPRLLLDGQHITGKAAVDSLTAGIAQLRILPGECRLLQLQDAVSHQGRDIGRIAHIHTVEEIGRIVDEACDLKIVGKMVLTARSGTGRAKQRHGSAHQHQRLHQLGDGGFLPGSDRLRQAADFIGGLLDHIIQKRAEMLPKDQLTQLPITQGAVFADNVRIAAPHHLHGRGLQQPHIAQNQRRGMGGMGHLHAAQDHSSAGGGIAIHGRRSGNDAAAHTVIERNEFTQIVDDTGAKTQDEIRFIRQLLFNDGNALLVGHQVALRVEQADAFQLAAQHLPDGVTGQRIGVLVTDQQHFFVVLQMLWQILQNIDTDLQCFDVTAVHLSAGTMDVPVDEFVDIHKNAPFLLLPF